MKAGKVFLLFVRNWGIQDDDTWANLLYPFPVFICVGPFTPPHHLPPLHLRLESNGTLPTNIQHIIQLALIELLRAQLHLDVYVQQLSIQKHLLAKSLRRIYRKACRKCAECEMVRLHKLKIKYTVRSRHNCARYKNQWHFFPKQTNST